MVVSLECASHAVFFSRKAVIANENLKAVITNAHLPFLVVSRSIQTRPGQHRGTYNFPIDFQRDPRRCTFARSHDKIWLAIRISRRVDSSRTVSLMRRDFEEHTER